MMQKLSVDWQLKMSAYGPKCLVSRFMQLGSIQKPNLLKCSLPTLSLSIAHGAHLSLRTLVLNTAIKSQYIIEFCRMYQIISNYVS